MKLNRQFGFEVKESLGSKLFSKIGAQLHLQLEPEIWDQLYRKYDNPILKQLDGKVNEVK